MRSSASLDRTYPQGCGQVQFRESPCNDCSCSSADIVRAKGCPARVPWSVVPMATRPRPPFLRSKSRLNWPVLCVLVAVASFWCGVAVVVFR